MPVSFLPSLQVLLNYWGFGEAVSFAGMARRPQDPIHSQITLHLTVIAYEHLISDSNN